MKQKFYSVIAYLIAAAFIVMPFAVIGLFYYALPIRDNIIGKVSVVAFAFLSYWLWKRIYRKMKLLDEWYKEKTGLWIGISTFMERKH